MASFGRLRMHLADPPPAQMPGPLAREGCPSNAVLEPIAAEPSNVSELPGAGPVSPDCF